MDIIKDQNNKVNNLNKYHENNFINIKTNYNKILNVHKQIHFMNTIWISIIFIILLNIPITFGYRHRSNVCKTIEIGPNNMNDLNDIKSCDVIEGSISIIRIDMKELNNSKSLLTSIKEINGYLLIYQVKGLKSLEFIFPNLSVIRGYQLFGKYSLIIYENIDLIDIGLKSLTNILNGSVRIENNPILCFVDTINWIKILSNMTSQHYILKKNKNSTECPTCPEVKTNKAAFIPCWNSKNMQKICPDSCKNRSCNSNGECCDRLCLSNCPNGTTKFCDICTYFKNNIRECVETCKSSIIPTFELGSRRCVPQEKCNDLGLVTYDGICMEDCPNGYYKRNHKCEPCQKQLCDKTCDGIIIRTKNDIKRLKGCTRINGSLTIELNEREGKVITELEENLSSIKEIDGYLRILKSPEIVSLYFFRNLRDIKGNDLFDGRYSLYVIENYHLEQLWMPKQIVNIHNGKLFFHFNPKLCYETIKKLQPHVSKQEDFSIRDVSNHSNGARVVCEPNLTNLNVTIEDKNSTAVRIKIDPILFDDKRLHLGYLYFYTETLYQNVTMYDSRHGCGHDNWKLDIDTSKNVRHIIKNLKPFTQYAYFVKTFTIATTHIKQDAFSEINYFQTLSDVPRPVRRFYSYAKNDTEIVLHWWPPSKPQGELKAYIIKILNVMNTTASDKIDQNNQWERFPRQTSDNQLCNCDIEKYQSRGPLPEEDDFYDQEAIVFEDSLTDFIFISVQFTTSKSTLHIANSTTNLISTNKTDVTSSNKNNNITNNFNSTKIIETNKQSNEGFIEIKANKTNIQNSTKLSSSTTTTTTTTEKNIQTDDKKHSIHSSEENLDDINEKKSRLNELLEKSKNEMDTGPGDFPILKSKNECDTTINEKQLIKFAKDPEECWKYYNGNIIDAKYHTITLKNLTPNMSYNISIRACNKNVPKCSVETITEGRTLGSTNFL